jgi:hypothetical protein
MEVAETFIEIHKEEHKHLPSIDECPVCEILSDRVYTEFYGELQENVEPIVEEFVSKWRNAGVSIANKYDSSISLAYDIVDIITYRISLRLPDYPFQPEDIVHHPYVIKKCNELTQHAGMHNVSNMRG